MIDKELRKLSREELLELLIEQTKEMEKLRRELEKARAELECKEIKLSRAGSIAEASLELNNVFAAAQAAADQYIENIRDTESICEKMRKETEVKAAKMLKAAENLAAKKEEEARINSEKYWNDLSKKLEKFYDEHKGLREMMQGK